MKKRILGLFILILAFISAGCSKESKTVSQSTISVAGIGTVFAQPDMVTLSVSLSHVARTTRLAQEDVSRKTRQVLDILKSSGIEDKSISTASLSFRTEYDYRTGMRTLIGQRAEQRLTFSVEDIKTDSDKVSNIIDQLIGINGIELNGINFGVKNNTEYFERSRELAFEKAAEKANQYAALSNLKIIKILSVSEEGFQQASPMNRLTNQMVAMEAAADTSSSTVLPAGELEITTRIYVVFLLE